MFKKKKQDNSQQNQVNKITQAFSDSHVWIEFNSRI